MSNMDAIRNMSDEELLIFLRILKCNAKGLAELKIN